MAYRGETILITRRGKPMAKLVPADAAERSSRRGSGAVAASWGTLRMGADEVRMILSEEDGLLDP